MAPTPPYTSFWVEFFRTVFFELGTKLRRRRLKRQQELHDLEMKLKTKQTQERLKAIEKELEARQLEHAISKHDIDNNPYPFEDEVNLYKDSETLKRNSGK